MAARRMMLPDYGTVSMKGTQYYRTRNGIQINFSSTTNKQIFICFKKCYNTNDDTVYAALYIRYFGFLK